MIGTLVASYHTAKADIYPCLHTELDSTLLLMAHRGFLNYHAWADIATTATALLRRMKKNNIPSVEAELPDGSYLSAVHVIPTARRNNTDPTQVRIIEFTVTPDIDQRVLSHHHPELRRGQPSGPRRSMRPTLGN